jgi:hypothetical protein
VRGGSLAIDMTFSSFDDYWQPLLGAGQTFGKYFDTLPPAAQSRTFDAVRAAYPVGDDDGPRSGCVRQDVQIGGQGLRSTRPFAVDPCAPPTASPC